MSKVIPVNFGQKNNRRSSRDRIAAKGPFKTRSHVNRRRNPRSASVSTIPYSPLLAMFQRYKPAT
jgi:hypothetical protein